MGPGPSRSLSSQKLGVGLWRIVGLQAGWDQLHGEKSKSIPKSQRSPLLSVQMAALSRLPGMLVAAEAPSVP
jgi:hypothetical protein